jgi:hypothetical protein
MFLGIALRILDWGVEVIEQNLMAGLGDGSFVHVGKIRLLSRFSRLVS